MCEHTLDSISPDWGPIGAAFLPFVKMIFLIGTKRSRVAALTEWISLPELEIAHEDIGELFATVAFWALFPIG